MVVFSPQLDGSFQALGHYSELKAAIPHRITQSDDQQLIMTSTPIEALDGYISEFVFSLSKGAFSYRNWWGFGGELTNRSQCDFVLL